MTLLRRFTTALRRLAKPDPRGRAMAREQEDGHFLGPGAGRASSFEADYYAAAGLMKRRMDARFPDAYHERLSSTEKPSYGYGEHRLGVVDTASTAIAMALREGATVEQAAEAGASGIDA